MSVTGDVTDQLPPDGGVDGDAPSVHTVVHNNENVDTNNLNRNNETNVDDNNDDNLQVNDDLPNDDSDGNQRPVRNRTSTEKGKAYQLSLLLSQRKSYHNRLFRQLTLVTQCLESTSVEMMHQEAANMDKIFSELVEINLKYGELVEEDSAKEECQQYFDEVDNIVFKKKTEVCTWLKENEYSDRGSSVSQSSRKSRGSRVSRRSQNPSKISRAGSRAGSRASNRSERSHKSNGSGRSNASSNESLQNKAHLAGLKVEMEALEVNWDSTLQEKLAKFQQEEEARMKEKLGMLKENIAVTEAKQEVFDVELMRDGKADRSRARKRSSSTMTHRKRNHRSPENRAKSSDRKVKTRHADKVESPLVSVNDLSKAVVDMIALNSAPKVELDTFSGNILEFEYFRANFKELVEEKVEDQRGRLARLLKYTSGDAKELIKGCVHEDSKTCYDRAMQLLVKEYGDPHETTCAYLKELSSWPSLLRNDVKGYKSMYRFLLKCQSLKRGGSLVELDSIEKIRTVLSKFPVSVQEAWNKNACKVREQAGSREADFNDLVAFIDMQCKLISNPSYSQGAFAKDTEPTDALVTAATHVVPGAPHTHEGGAKHVHRPRNPSQDPPHNPQNPQNIVGPPNLGAPHTQEAAAKHVHWPQNLSQDPSHNPQNPNHPCLCCGDINHNFEHCPEYLALPLSERRKFVFHNRLCFSCLAPTTPTHNGKTCTQKRTCQKCSQMHPTCLQHFSVSHIRQPGGNATSLPIVPVIVHHKDHPDQTVSVYAMLDECSQGTFIKDSVLVSLSAAPVRHTSIAIETLNSIEVMKCKALENLVVRAVPEHHNMYPAESIKLPICYTQETLPIDSKDLPPPESFACWPYLATAAKLLYCQGASIPVGLLIGANCPKALEPRELIPSQGDGPYAYRSRLGWCIVGSILANTCDVLRCNATAVRIPMNDVSTNSTSMRHFGMIKSVRECNISEQLNDMYMHDFVEAQPEKKALSGEDVKFLELMDEGIKRESDGHYSLPLPFRNSNINLSSNRAQVVHRIGSQKKKRKRDPKYHEEYNEFMRNLIKEGFAIKVDVSEKGDDDVYYIPHHAVYHPIKGTMRVVFDCAALFHGKCLNDELLQGPDLANLIVGVLIRWRLEEIAVQADIKSMFFQVYVPKHHQKYLRFVYWPDGDLEADLEDYQMCSHLFGAKSSTSCCIYALRRTALDNKDKYAKEVCDTILNNFYVDDLLKSYSNDMEAVDQILKVIELCGEGGFTLSKFVSNSEAVMKALPEERKASLVHEVDVSKNIQIARALGVLWYLEIDQLGFRISMENKPLTRSGMLSIISSIFDPFGIAGPFVKPGKGILKSVNAEKRSWEDPVSEEHAAAWTKWKQGLLDLSKLKVNRCYKPAGFGKAVHSSIHCFSDASDTGYGQATYLRQENEAGDIAVSLVMGKSRVAPSKVTTIPRLELVAATVSVKVAALVKEELQIPELGDAYYTDSEIVLGYIGNEVKRFRTFVANRRQIINTYTNYEKWRHVISAENPADLASRGMSASETEKVNLWIHGPELLRAPRSSWQLVPPSVTVNDSDPEVINNVCVLASMVENTNDILSCLEKRISRWEKMLRIVAYILKAIDGFKGTLRKSSVDDAVSENNNFGSQRLELSTSELSHISAGELLSAENTLVGLIQQRSYAGEINVYRDTRNNKRSKTRLSALDPFLDEEGILRVGGRMRKSGNPDVVKHPVILPEKAIATRCLVRHHHQKAHHSGRTTTIGEIRQSGFWVVNLNSCVRSVIYKCVPCRAFRGKLAGQKMADLPDHRTAPEGPFVHVGVDMFGHFFVKEKRSQVKRYVAMFTCMSSRAVHLEMTKDMSTNSFIQALRRLLARRGAIKSIRSDNGTNFVGAENELLKAWKEMDHKKIEEFLLGRKCDWINWERNPPSASHMGGVWERQIRTIRNIMTSLLHEHSDRLDDEALRTLLCEAECVVNSRPLTVETLGDAHAELLTPNHLLTMKSKVVLPPPGAFQKEDVYCRKRWRAVQYLANQFWVRWRKEFLVTLQQRNKWVSPKRNFQVDDVVLIKEDDCSRNQWPMGRVVNVIESEDHLVRAVDLRCPRSKSILRRPIHKLVLLVGADEQ